MITFYCVGFPDLANCFARHGHVQNHPVYMSKEEAEKDADPYYHCSSTADRTEFYTGKGNFADDSFPDPIPGYRL